MKIKTTLISVFFATFLLFTLSNAVGQSNSAQGTIVSDVNHNATQMKIISPGDQSLSLEEQLKGVQAPQSIMPENPVAVSQLAQINYPIVVGNETQIDALQSELQNMFSKADKNADKLTKYEQYTLYLLYKQTQQNQLILEQNNKIILALEKISLQNERFLKNLK